VQHVGEIGIAAYFTDSEGNLMGLWVARHELKVEGRLPEP
jgi:predicted enzyme related to lactoylglutathione lyase